MPLPFNNIKILPGGGAGGGVQSLSQRFSDSDFALVSGNWVARFTDSIPAGAVPIGVVYNILGDFDAGITLRVQDTASNPNLLGLAVPSDAIKILNAEHGDVPVSGIFDFQ